MIIEPGYLGYLKYEGDTVEEGIMDARDAASALLGFDEAFRYCVEQEKPTWNREDLNLPVRIEKGCWQILIPAGLAVFAGQYLKSTAKIAAEDGLFETSAAKDLNRILKASLSALVWLVKISKHLGAVGDKSRASNAKIRDSDHVVVLNDQNEEIVVTKRQFDLYCQCPKALLGQCARIIDENCELEIGRFENGAVIDSMRIFPEERTVFYSEKEDSEIILPELEHGKFVSLEGEITRATESTNTIGFHYQGHTLFCRPERGQKIASFKQRIISRQDDHIFPRVHLVGVVNRSDKHGGFRAKKPEIVFSEILSIEMISGELL
ncbi:MAG: hypothetical protein JJU05_09980 [Verrucomicrobia bacterium]|nr:hypothetical protein [Verrucomicrobiota bacterium]MCH8526616.1 hypothetical protein [Kiritimatiellia bacterium]